MIGVDFEKLYLNLDDIIPVDQFLSLTDEICEGISKSSIHYCHPGNRAYGIDGYPELLLPFDAENTYKDETAKMSDNEKRVYLKYRHKVLYSSTGIFIKKHNGYLNKHLAEHSEYTENAQYFPKLIEYIENALPFKQIGRVFIFLQDHFAPLTEHRDSMNDDFTNEPAHFLWFTIDKNALKFYIKDNEQNKHYIEDTTCAWFNENDRHGSPGVPDATFCFRVDGVFTDEFLSILKSRLCM